MVAAAAEDRHQSRSLTAGVAVAGEVVDPYLNLEVAVAGVAGVVAEGRMPWKKATWAEVVAEVVEGAGAEGAVKRGHDQQTETLPILCAMAAVSEQEGEAGEVVAVAEVVGSCYHLADH